MDFQDAVKSCFQKYGTFPGRARRAEFWWFHLFLFLAFMVAIIIDHSLFEFDEYSSTVIPIFSITFIGLFIPSIAVAVSMFEYEYVSSPIFAITFIGLLIPSIAVGVRRLHDIGRSGWWFLLWYVPLINLLILYWSIKVSQPGTNEYGPNPLLSKSKS